ncbi:cation diffusion facilitator family transporter [Brevibacillus choshinensis]|uniref:Cation transporter n=1 Tax=Brevibacillus choshinensis TaxID=54911 RepID=A0ABX7FV65_BRECH|nr:cation diffusion facilitator family transporter [Brevibacillus choshinensis]QRG70144.1 cation transporter [Brevibacillus choshinensis]
MEIYEDIKKGEKGAWISIITYICLSILKLGVGYVSNSEALLADGLNNTTDIIASIAVLIGLKISRKPPDKDHPYGHFRAETISALIASFIMISVGIQVLYQAVIGLFSPDVQAPDLLAAWTALFCAMIMFIVYRYNRQLAQKIKSQAMMAAAQDNRSDALVSIGAFIGIMGSQLGLPWLDSLTAVVVGVIICKTAWDIFREATHTLTDGFDEETLETFKQTIEDTPGVEFIKDIKARKHGSSVLVDAVITVDHRLNVIQSHEITEEIEKKMLREYRIRHVHVHIEPK